MTGTTKVGRAGAVMLAATASLLLCACGAENKEDVRQTHAAAAEEAKQETKRGGVLHSSNQLGNSAIHSFTVPFFDKDLGAVVYRHCVLVEGLRNDQLDCSDPM